MGSPDPNVDEDAIQRLRRVFENFFPNARVVQAGEQNTPFKERCLQGLDLLGFSHVRARRLEGERFGFVLEPGAEEVVINLSALDADLPGTLQWLAASHPRKR